MKDSGIPPSSLDVRLCWFAAGTAMASSTRCS